jgi:threonine/homoserine/homoserine lactone efflux protein
VEHLAALVGFSFVSSITPGPNNILLWASGATFGFRRTVPHVLGTAIGLGAMTLAIATGLGVLITSVPAIGVAMKIAGSAYLLYLAVRVARGGAIRRTDVKRPLSLGQAAAFQVVNVKAWIFALGAVTTFRPPDLPFVAGTILVAAVMMVVIVPSASAWSAGGGVLSRFVGDGNGARIVSVVLGVAIVISVLSVWAE